MSCKMIPCHLIKFYHSLNKKIIKIHYKKCLWHILKQSDKTTCHCLWKFFNSENVIIFFLHFEQKAFIFYLILRKINTIIYTFEIIKPTCFIQWKINVKNNTIQLYKFKHYVCFIYLFNYLFDYFHTYDFSFHIVLLQFLY